MSTTVTTIDQSGEGRSGAFREMGPLEFIRILRRRKTLILLTILLITGLTGLVLTNVTPLYRSDAVAIVEMPDMPDDDPAAAIAKARENEIQITTFLQLLQSRNMAALVVRDMALDDDREFNPTANPDKVVPETGLLARVKQLIGLEQPVPPPATKAKAPKALPPPSEADLERVVDRLMKNLTVTQINKSNLIGVTAYSVDARKAQRIANKLIAVSINSQINRRQSNIKDTIGLLNKRVEELRKQVIAGDGRVADYRKAHGIAEGPGTQIQIDQLSSELAGARSSRVESEARSRALNAMAPTGAVTASAGSATSPVLADLQTQEITLQRRIAELSPMYGQGHPDMINAKAQLAAVQQRITGELSRIGSGLAAETSARRDREYQLSHDIGALRAQTFEQGIASVGLMDLQRDADTSRTLYVTLLSRLKELQRQDQQSKADATFESRAALPMSTTYPATKRILAVAFAASLIIAAILAFAAESMDGRIRTSEQVERLTGSPALAMIPEISKSWEDLPAYIAVLERPCSAFSEALRTLQLELSSRHPEKAAQVVVVTSPLPGEGKTTISMSVAAAAAAMGTELGNRGPGPPPSWPAEHDVAGRRRARPAGFPGQQSVHQ